MKQEATQKLIDRQSHDPLLIVVSGISPSESNAARQRGQGGLELFEREVWSDFTPNSFTQTLYVGDAPEKAKSMIESANCLTGAVYNSWIGFSARNKLSGQIEELMAPVADGR